MNGSNGTRPGSNGQHPLANLTGARLSYELPQAGHISSPFAYRPPALHAPANPPNRRPSGDVAVSPSTGSSESSPATGTSGGVVAGKSNGKAATVTKRASSGKEDERERDSKKARQALSCSECKVRTAYASLSLPFRSEADGIASFSQRRKIKCDRSIPCSACIKRGEPESCSWEEAKIEPAP